MYLDLEGCRDHAVRRDCRVCRVLLDCRVSREKVDCRVCLEWKENLVCLEHPEKLCRACPVPVATPDPLVCQDGKESLDCLVRTDCLVCLDRRESREATDCPVFLGVTGRKVKVVLTGAQGLLVMTDPQVFLAPQVTLVLRVRLVSQACLGCRDQRVRVVWTAGRVNQVFLDSKADPVLLGSQETTDCLACLVRKARLV